MNDFPSNVDYKDLARDDLWNSPARDAEAPSGPGPSTQASGGNVEVEWPEWGDIDYKDQGRNFSSVFAQQKVQRQSQNDSRTATTQSRSSGQSPPQQPGFTPYNNPAQDAPFAIIAHAEPVDPSPGVAAQGDDPSSDDLNHRDKPRKSRLGMWLATLTTVQLVILIMVVSSISVAVSVSVVVVTMNSNEDTNESQPSPSPPLESVTQSPVATEDGSVPGTSATVTPAPSRAPVTPTSGPTNMPLAFGETARPTTLMPTAAPSPRPTPVPSTATPTSSTEEPTTTAKCFDTGDELRTAVDAYVVGNVGVTNLYGPIRNWCVSRVTDFSGVFESHTTFNEPLDGWDTSAATTMDRMFYNTPSFNQPLSTFDTSSVTSMVRMFSGPSISSSTTSFNADISGWDMGRGKNHFCNLFARSILSCYSLKYRG